MTKYAADTSVSSHKSREEIEKTLARYGADQFMYGSDINKAVVAFRMAGRNVKFLIEIPARNERQFTHTPTKEIERSPAQAEAEYEKAVRQRWRALALVIKAKLEAVESGITEFEDEFMAHIVLPDGTTMGAWARPQIEQAYKSGQMPTLLPQLEDKST